MPPYTPSPGLFSEDTIAPSSSASQVLTSQHEPLTEVLSSSLSCSPPLGLEITRLHNRTMIIPYPTLSEKIPLFEAWWNETAFVCERKDSRKHRIRWGGKERSPSVWKGFREGAVFPKGEPKVYCIRCLHDLTHPGLDGFGTSSMNYHEKKGCKKKTSSTASKRTITEMMIQNPDSPATYNKKEFLDQVLRFIIACRLPFRTVEHIQFKRMISLAAASSSHQLHLPNRAQIKDRLMVLSEETHIQLLSKLPHDGKISIAIDCWTSPDQKAFLAMTGYFLTEEMSYHEVLLGFQPLHGSHEGEALAGIVLSVLHKHNLSHRVLGITTDNASNNGTMFSLVTAKLKAQLLESTQLQDTMTDPELLKIIKNQHHIPCLAHVIQLSVTALLKNLHIEASNDAVLYTWDDGEENLAADYGISRTLEKVRKIAKFINASPQRRERFHFSQRIDNGSAICLLLDCKTRWNSTYLMIRRILRLRQPIEHFLQCWDTSDLSYLRPTPIEWRQLEYLMELLFPFYLFTTCLSENDGPTVHKAYDIYNNLFDHLDTAIDRLSRKRAAWKKQILAGLEDAHLKLRKYYQRTYQAEGYLYAIATILDPTSKLEKFKTGAWADDDMDWHGEYRRVFENVFDFYRNHNPNIDVRSAVSGSLSGLDRAFFHISKRRKPSPSPEIYEELKTYLDIESTAGQTDILAYWRSRRDQLPILYRMARDFLTIATNGVGVERLFNSSRDICRYRRSRLQPDIIEAIMLQMCTDRFVIREEYKNILDEMEAKDIELILDDHQQEDDLASVMYISDVEDLDNLENDPEDGSILASLAEKEHSLPSTSKVTRTQRQVGSTQGPRSLRYHNRHPGQYKE